MNPEAKAFIGTVVQISRERFQDPWHLIRLHEYGGAETHKWMLMIVGSVLLPEVDGHPFYLDDPAVRQFIRSQLEIQPRDFFNNANIATWGRLSVLRGDATLGRRFYAVNKQISSSWGFTIVFNDAEKAADDSAVPADAVTLPDFESITDKIRYRAMGA